MTQLGFQILNAWPLATRENEPLSISAPRTRSSTAGSQAEVLETMERLANEGWPKRRAGR